MESEPSIGEINERGLWKHPSRAWKLFIAGYFVIFVGFYVIGGYQQGTTASTIVLAAGWLICILGVLFALISYKTFWVEPQLLEEADANWQPSRTIYIGLSFLLTPMLMAGVYSLNRSRKLTGVKEATSDSESKDAREESSSSESDSSVEKEVPLGAHPDQLED